MMTLSPQLNKLPRVFWFVRGSSLLLLYLCECAWIPLAFSGVCWEKVDVFRNLCQNAFHINISFEECCDSLGNANVAWSPHTLASDIFYYNFLAGGADQCHRCHKNCSNVQCESGKVCRMRKGLPVCVCKSDCDHELRKRGRVCGSDGRVYKNVCALQKHNCLAQTNVYMKYLGKCRSSCKHVKCSDGQSCLEDQNGLPHCIKCSQQCARSPETLNPVCGVNGVTYNNTCHLKAAICRKGKSIKISYEGACQANLTCSEFRCPVGQTCLTNPANGQPVCQSCDDGCVGGVHRSVCGTDGRTYSGYCNMVKVACSTQMFITTDKSGRCKRKTQDVTLNTLRIISSSPFEDNKTRGNRWKGNTTSEKRSRRRRREQKRRERKRKRQRQRQKSKTGDKQMRSMLYRYKHTDYETLRL